MCELATPRSDKTIEQMARATSLTPRKVDWSAAVNGVLRALRSYIELDADMHAVRAEWSISEWRAA